jgi:TctA family transporter
MSGVRTKQAFAAVALMTIITITAAKLRETANKLRGVALVQATDYLC